MRERKRAKKNNGRVNWHMGGRRNIMKGQVGVDLLIE